MLENSIHRPYWYNDASHQEYPYLNENIKCDIAIVGAGITGLTAAINFLKAGLNVVVLEMNTIPQSATALSTGHLDCYYDQEYKNLIKHYGLDSAAKIIHAKKSAIDTIEQLVNEYHIQCDFKRLPAHLYCENPGDKKLLIDEKDSASQMNINCSQSEKNPLPFTIQKTITFPDQARFSPFAYIEQLAAAFVKSGGRIFEHTAMKSFRERDRDVVIYTADGTIEAGHLILCGHTSLTGKLSLQTRIYPMLSFAIAVEVEDQIEDALYWDTDQPYHYTRIASSDNPNTLIIGGADCHVGIPDDTMQYYEDLLAYAKQRYTIKSIRHHWCSEFYESVDGLPYAGIIPSCSNVLVASAYSGDGLTFGTMSAKLVCDLVMNKENSLAPILSPKRFKPLTSFPKLTKIVGHAAKHLVVDRITAKEHDPEHLHPGDGMLMRFKNHVTAVYKDDHGEVHTFSASCRHMGCIIRWNSAEKTWDCPCHGGRYDAMGNCLSGPPCENLKIMHILASIEH